jgi:hypothetical protein
MEKNSLSMSFNETQWALLYRTGGSGSSFMAKTKIRQDQKEERLDQQNVTWVRLERSFWGRRQQQEQELAPAICKKMVEFQRKNGGAITKVRARRVSWSLGVYYAAGKTPP